MTLPSRPSSSTSRNAESGGSVFFFFLRSLTLSSQTPHTSINTYGVVTQSVVANTTADSIKALRNGRVWHLSLCEQTAVTLPY